MSEQSAPGAAVDCDWNQGGTVEFEITEERLVRAGSGMPMAANCLGMVIGNETSVHLNVAVWT